MQAKLNDSRQIAFRVLGLLLGIAAVGVGIVFLIFPEYDGWYRRYVVPLAMFGTGVYFLNYAITGRPRFGMRRGSSAGN